MIFDVTLKVEVDVDGWAEEYGVKAGEALKQVFADLREPGWYLASEKWSGLATVKAVTAQITLGAGGLGIDEDALANAINHAE